ncbi:MAG: transcriptional regulator [Acidobacteriota bacterium]|nr:transcriptional regulator [Acidobacteriota bacterium]
MAKVSTPVYQFGPFILDIAEERLTRGGMTVRLTSKRLAILSLLVQEHGHLVRKDELMRMIWPDSDVEENNLTVNISALRKALGESSKEGKYIETVPGRGYRFVAEVRRIQGEDEEA